MKPVNPKHFFFILKFLFPPLFTLKKINVFHQVRRWLHHHLARGRAGPGPTAGDGVHRAGIAGEHVEGETPQHAAVPAPLFAHLPRPNLLPSLQKQGGAQHRGLLCLSDYIRPSKQANTKSVAVLSLAQPCSKF